MRLAVTLAVLLLSAGCGGSDETDSANDAPRRDDPPVALDAEPPVVYPAELYRQGIEGTVTLRLYVDDKGTVLPESTLVAESSGYAEFDSAAVAGVPRMRFAPAQRDGRPVAIAFTQPVHFRRPENRGTTQ
jgi:periplasmic protein TonB